jgi:2'-5' RNA ligase
VFMHMGKERLFLAVGLGTEQRAGIERNKELLQQTLPFQKWVHPDDLHVTLKFLGDTDADTASKIRAAMKELAGGYSPLTLALQGLGVFGKPSAPSILWLGLGGEMPALANLQAQVEDAVKPLGFTPEDRPYRPHITIARRYNGTAPFSPGLLTEAGEAMESIPQQWTVDRFVLYKSHLSRKPMYEPIDTFEFS